MTVRTIKGVKYLVTGSPDLIFYRKEGRVDSYRVTRHGCSCPATRDCKHMADAVEVRSDMIMDELKALVDAPHITIWSVLNADQHQG